MLEIKNLVAGYGKAAVIKNINLQLKKGEITCIIGKNGCGKSTLLKTVTGIISPLEGEIFAEGQALSQSGRKEIAKMLAYLPQSKNIPDMTVGQLVLHGRFPYLEYPRRYSQNDREIAFSSMRQLNISDLEHRPLSTLSGGMCQNAFIAMALAQSTDYVLLDEPTTHLDIGNSLGLMETLFNLAKSGKGIVTVLHDITLAMEYSHRIVLMDNGEIIGNDTPEKIYSSGMISQLFGVKLKRQISDMGYSYFIEKTKVE